MSHLSLVPKTFPAFWGTLEFKGFKEPFSPSPSCPKGPTPTRVTHRLTSLSHHGWPCVEAACAESSRVPPELGAGHQDSEASCQPCWASFLHWWRYGYLDLLGTSAITVLGEGQGSPGTSGCQELVAPLEQWERGPRTLGLEIAGWEAPQRTGSPAGTRLLGDGQCQVVQPGEAGGLQVAHSPFLLYSATLLGLQGRRCQTQI